MKFDKGTPPFSRGDRLRMLEEGFSIAKGCIVTAGSVKWVKGHEWCVEVHVKNHYGCPVGYRASRFEKVEEHETMNYLFAIMAMGPDEVPINGTLEWVSGDHKQVEEAIGKALKNYPDRKYLYGRFDREGKVVSPPVKFGNI